MQNCIYPSVALIVSRTGRLCCCRRLSGVVVLKDMLNIPSELHMEYTCSLIE